MKNEKEITAKLQEAQDEIDNDGDYRYYDAIKDALEWVLDQGEAI